MDFEIKIDPEFHSLIPPLSDEEFVQLEQNLIDEGCRDSLVVWKEMDILVDGHNRFEICERHKIPYKVHKISLPDRHTAMVWTIKNQVGRRNLSETQRAMCAARLANLERGDNQHTAIAGTSQKDVAKLFNVSEDSIGRAKAVLATRSTELIEACDKDQIAVSAAAEIATLPTEVHADVIASGKKGISAAVNQIKKKKTEKKKKEKQERKKKLAAIGSTSKDFPRMQINHADFRDGLKKLKDGSVDVIITDPPYPREFLPLYKDLAKDGLRVLKPGGSMLVMVGQSYLPEILESMVKHIKYQWIVAYLTPGGQSAQLWQREINTFWKPVLWFVNGEYEGNWVGDVVQSEVNDNDKRFHGWGQSESGMISLVEKFSDEDDLVLDPFVGGGTTALVCAMLKRKFIGFDVDEDSVNVTKGRLVEWEKNK
jgi:16S rRNA G966 N2-methylase RsmD